MISKIVRKLAPCSAARGRSQFVWRAFRCLAWLIIIYVFYSAYKIYADGHFDDGEKADCAIVLGAAAWHKKPSPVFAARLDHAIRLYHGDRVKKLLLTGGKGVGAPFAESEVALAYCLRAQVKPEDIRIETVSLTTFENIREAQRMMTAGGLRDALIVSDPWHLRRALLMAKAIGIVAKPSATQTSMYQSWTAKSAFFFREFFYVQIFHVLGI